MIPYRFLIFAWVCMARPNLSTSVLSPSTNLLALNLTLPLPLPSLTLSSAPSVTKAGITCFASGPRTTVDGCRVALNYLKEFPNYKRLQPFQEGRCPEIGGGKKPPLLIFAGGATCAIEIAAGGPLIVDAFSFEEVRKLATEIVEDCQDVGGHGGWSPIGRGVGWHVRVIGVDAGEVKAEGNGTVLLKGVRAGKGRLETEVVLDES